jgi:hypothetical protein
MAFGALLHNTAAATVIFCVLPTAWTLLAMGALDRLRAWLDTMQTFGWVLAGHWDGHLSQILTSTAVWVLARHRCAERVSHGREAGAIHLLTSSFNHVVDEPVVAVYDYFQPGG